jgi:hypothetical protein
MNLIAKQTIGSGGASSVTFSSIPDSYTDLKVVISVRTNVADIYQSGGMYINSIAADNSYRSLRGNGASATSGNGSGQNEWYCGEWNGSTSTSNTFTSSEIYIPNYRSSNQKSFSAETVDEANSSTAIAMMVAGLCTKTAPITSITFQTFGGGANNFVEFSTFYLYGISNSTTTQATTVPYASGGDVITTNGTYWYHTFLYSGTFTPLKNLTCDYLVVAGGGGGGSANLGGGGGGGGLRSTVTATGGGGTLETAASLISSTFYTVTVGAGGVTVPDTSKTNGSNSSIAGTGLTTITSVGGGAGANDSNNGSSGGSGGGGNSGWNPAASNGGAGTTNQGYAGGNGNGLTSTYANSGGGGGAGGIGQNGNTTSSTGGRGGNGGSGLSVSISGSSVTYAGGGAGSTYFGNATGTSNGGGGSGNYLVQSSGGIVSTAGTANTGGGGGANKSGGSGIIIIRYPV